MKPNRNRAALRPLKPMVLILLLLFGLGPGTPAARSAPESATPGEKDAAVAAGQPADAPAFRDDSHGADPDGPVATAGQTMENGPQRVCDSFGEQRCTVAVPVHKSVVKRTDKDITRASVADPKIADIEVLTARQVLILAGSPGVTNLILWHGDKVAHVHEVRVFVPGNLIAAVNQAVARLAPGSRVQLIPGGKEGVILTGEVDGPEMLERVLAIVKGYDLSYVDLLSVVGSQQVQLEVKIAEVSRSGAKKMGLGYLYQSQNSIGLFPNGSAKGVASVTEAVEPDSVVSIFDTADDSVTQFSIPNGGVSQRRGMEIEMLPAFGSAFQLVLSSLDHDFLSIISLLKSQGLAQMLATPTLVTMSGQQAEFLVGGEFPVPTESIEGGTNIEYKSYGIILQFTPFVTGRETISIQVAPEVSSPDYSLAVFSGGVAVPGLRSRRGSTTLQLKDGQTFIMAGLLQEDWRTNVNKVPILGDIPILGALFTSKEYQRNETELIVMVTPRLVRALNPEEIPELPAMPGSDAVSDVDFFLLNRTAADLETSDDKALDETPADREPVSAADMDSVPGFRGQTGFIR